MGLCPLMRRMTSVLFVVILASGCGSPEEATPAPSSISQLAGFTSEALSTTDTAAQLIGAHKQQYHVLKFSSEDSVSDIENSLNLLGQEGWDCAPMNQGRGASIQFFCKRRTSDIAKRIVELGGELFETATKEKKRDSSRF